MKKLPFPHKKDGRYYNNKTHRLESLIFGTIPGFIQTILGRPEQVPLQEFKWLQRCTPRRATITPTVTWLGHSTFLLQMGGVNILTDPIFGDLSYFHRRVFECPVEPTDLPPIDCVLISHNHRDHMDEKSLMMLRDHADIRILVPEGDKKWFDTRGFKNVFECMWWDKIRFTQIGYHFCGNFTFTFLPATHWSQRTLFDQNKSLWGSWMIEWESTRIYFAGDTAYSSHFSIIGEEFAHIDLAILPIGPGEPRSWMRQTHINASEAVQAFIDLKAFHLVPMHWGTFSLGLDDYEMPLTLLRKEWQQHASALTKNEKLQVLKMGQQVELIKNIDDPVLHIKIGDDREIML